MYKRTLYENPVSKQSISHPPHFNMRWNRLSFVSFFLLGFVQADIVERVYNSTQRAELGANDILIIYGTGKDDKFTYNNYSGSGVVYFKSHTFSKENTVFRLNTNIPNVYTSNKVFVIGNAFSLYNSTLSSNSYGSNRIIVLTNELPNSSGGIDILPEGALLSNQNNTTTYDNPIQIKGVGGVRQDWGKTLIVSGKISDYVDDNNVVTPGKLIIECDGNDIRLTNGSNDYSGGTQIGGGNVPSGGVPASGSTTLTVYANGTPLGTGPISFGYNTSSSNSSLVLNNHTITLGGFDGDKAGSVNGSGSLTIQNDSDYSAPGITLSGITSLIKNGSGSQTVGATNVTGSTEINAGILKLMGDSTLYNLSGGSDSNPVTLDVTGKTLTLNNTELTKFIGSITASSVTVNATDDAPFQIYTAANGLVDADSFVVSSGRVDVKGCMEANVSVEADATFSPGNSVGNVNIDGDFTLNGDLLIEVDATGADTLVCEGFTLNGGTVMLNWQDDEIPFFATCDLITSTSDLSDVYANLGENLDFSTSPEVEQLFNDGYITLQLVAGNSNNIIRLSIDRNAVPEPSTWALLVLGVAALFLRKRVRS